MNRKRGFRRIAFVLGIVVAVAFAGLAVTQVLFIYDSAQSNLQWEQRQYREKYGVAVTPDQARAELRRRATLSPEDRATEEEKRRAHVPKIPEGFVLDGSHEGEERATAKAKLEELEKYLALEREADRFATANKAKLEELENGFWVSLSSVGLVGICTLAGLFGGLIGFASVWLIYRLFEWLVLGFCDDNRLHPERT